MESLEKMDLFKDISCSGHRGQDIQNRQAERQAIQKRTFTRWINIHLKRQCEPPLKVQDLFLDVQDGRVLMALLEELSDCKMLYRFRPSTHRIFRLNNIAKVLNFLEDRNVKCKSIDASDVADGIPSAVLGLIWTIIVLFHIKMSTRSIKHIFSTNSTRSINGSRDTTPTSPSATNNNWDSNTFPSQRRKSSHTSKYRGTAIKTLLRWVQTCTSKYDVEVRDFGRSWRSGLAFLALIKSIDPALVDIRTAMTKSPQENVEEAFCLAHSVLGIPPLLDLEDVTIQTPDEQSIITYVTQFLQYRQNLDEINSSQPYAGTSPEGLHYSSSGPEKHPSIIEPSLYTSEESMSSPAESSIKPNDVFRMDSIEGQNFVNSVPLKATRGQAYGSSSVDVETLSLSSEEGVYMLSALDSEEEEAYQYILALDEETNETQRPNFLEFQTAITADEQYPVVNVCQCREETGSKNRHSCTFGFQQMAPIMLNEVALDENANTNHNGFVSVPLVDEICGQKVSSELIMATKTNLQTDRESCAQENSHTAVETSKPREYLAYRKEGNGIRERLSAKLEPNDLCDDLLKALDLFNNDMTNGKHIDQKAQHSQWVETNQTDEDTNSEQTSQTQAEFLLQEEVEVMGEREMSVIQETNEKPLERESTMDNSTEGQEELVEWDKHNLLSSQDITEVNAVPTREVALFSGGAETCCSIDLEELNMLIWLWILTYCLFILPQLNVF